MMLVRMYNILLLFALALSVNLCRNVATASTGCTAIEPIPSGLSCGIRGNIKYNYRETYDPPTLPQIVDSVETCAVLCARRLVSKHLNQTNVFDPEFLNYYCPSFKYNAKTNLCQFGATRLGNHVNSNSKSDFVFYDLDCFDCGAPCPQPHGTQLLDNGGFEGDLLGPWAVVDDGVKSTIGKGFGSKSSFRSNGALLQQALNLCKNQLYAIQFDYLALEPSDRMNSSEFQLSFGDSGLKDLYYQTSRVFSNTVISNNTDRTAWKRKQVYFPFRGGEHFGPEFRITRGSHHIDNVKVSAVPMPRIKEGARSLLVNGGWETGTIEGWTSRNFESRHTHFTVVSPGINSSYLLSFKATFDRFYSPSLSQIVATTPNTTYLFSFDSQAKGYQTVFHLNIGSPDDLFEFEEYYLSGKQAFSLPVLATGHSLNITFYTRFNNLHGHSTLLMDNFRFIEVERSKYFP